MTKFVYSCVYLATKDPFPKTKYFDQKLYIELTTEAYFFV